MSSKVSVRFSGLKKLEERLNQAELAGKRRHLKVFETLDGVNLRLNNGKMLLDFSGNDYLGFSRHSALLQAATETTQKFGTSTTSSRLIRGTFELQEQLEQTLCRFLNAPSALVYNTGYQANVGVLSALIQRHDAVFSDRLNHASLIDGIQLSGAKATRYAHNDMLALENMLKASTAETKWIVSETVFSMDGDCVDLKTLFALSQKYNAWLILDEAHAVGVFGQRSRSGFWETLELPDWPENVIVIGTFSKALGSYGAYVAGHQAVRELLINQSRSFIYSTGLPPACIAANQAALELLMSDASHTQKLWENIHHAESCLGLALTSAIVPVVVGGNDKTMALSQALWHAGFFVQGIRPPTVPEGSSRLRITLSALHERSQIEALAHFFKHTRACHSLTSS